MGFKFIFGALEEKLDPSQIFKNRKMPEMQPDKCYTALLALLQNAQAELLKSARNCDLKLILKSSSHSAAVIIYFLPVL